MARLALIIVTATLVISTTLAAPWVVLDSGSDMLAMSSEVSDSVVAVMAPPVSKRGRGSEEDDYERREVVIQPGTTLESEESPSYRETPTTQEPSQAEVAPGAISRASTTEPSFKIDIISPTTDIIYLPKRTGEKQMIESTTARVGAMVESDLKHENMNIPIVLEQPTFPDQHPNSIEDDDLSLEPIVLMKKKHTVFDKRYLGSRF